MSSYGKAKGPMREHRAFTENLPCSPVRLRAEQRDSTTPLKGKGKSATPVCPVCGASCQRGELLTVPLFGRRFAAVVCVMCRDAAITSTSFRESAVHKLAQHQHHREACHA